MNRISQYLFTAAIVLALTGLTSVSPNLATENHPTFDEPDQYPAYIFVHNRSYYVVSVYFNGNHVGNLNPGSYYTWTVNAGYNYHIRTYWENGNYNYWDARLGPQQTYRCLTGY